MCAKRNEPLVPCPSFPDAGTTVSRLPCGIRDIRVEGAGKNGRENYAATRTAQCINNNLCEKRGGGNAKDGGRRRFIRGAAKKRDAKLRCGTKRVDERKGRNVNHVSNAE